MAWFDSETKQPLLLAESDECVACPRQRSYHAERTGSRQIPAVKQRRVSIVPGWVTAWEVEMLLAYFRFSIFDFLFAVVVLLATARRHWRTATHGPRVRSLASGAFWERENERWAFFHVGGSSSLFVCLAFSSVELCRVVEFEASREHRFCYRAR